MSIKKRFLFVILFYYIYIIFSFSARPASISNADSAGLVNFAYKIVHAKTGIKKYIPQKKITKVLTTIIRKTAHFLNFFMVSVIMLFYLECYDRKKIYKFLTVAFFCFIIAVLDEVLQLFFEGRACSIIDVYIDFSGAALGMFLYNLPSALFYNECKQR